MVSKIKKIHLLYVVLALFILFEVVIFFQAEDKKVSFRDLAVSTEKYCTENAALTKGKENCYAEEFKKFGEEYGPEASFEILNSLQQIDQSAVGCHLISHGIGWGSYKREPENWRGLVQRLPTICNYGSIHGVLESYILSLPEKSLNKEVIPTICGDVPRADCNHIIGHLILVQTDADVPKALELCEVFSDPVQNNYCISGVFMEYQTALNLVSHDLVPQTWLNWPLRIGELEKLCRAQTGKWAEGCWEEIVHVAAATFRSDAKKVFDFCSTSQSPIGAKKCKRHAIGVLAASKNFKLLSLKDMCDLPQKNDPTFRNECYPALVSSALSTIPTEVPEAVAFCNTLGSSYKPGCFSMIGMMGYSTPIVKNMLQASCMSAPADLQNYCLGVSSSLENPNDFRTSKD